MSLFVCERCGVVENTALSLYWVRDKGPALCSGCDPRIGSWHGAFPREEYNPAKHRVLNRPQRGVAADFFPPEAPPNNTPKPEAKTEAKPRVYGYDVCPQKHCMKKAGHTGAHSHQPTNMGEGGTND